MIKDLEAITQPVELVEVVYLPLNEWLASTKPESLSILTVSTWRPSVPWGI